MSLSRRTFLYTSPLALAPFLTRSCDDPLDDYRNQSNPFQHGVASGDPLSDAVVLWTRVSKDARAPEAFAVGWAVAKDPEFRQVVARGLVSTDASVDFTAKVDADGLEPGRTYYYRFRALGHDSPIGRTRTTAKRGGDRLRFAVLSCSNYPYGYFNAYASVAARADLDAVLHLGDYLYEYANGQFGDGTTLDRVPVPNKEIVSLADYRARHAQYKTDPDLQEAHRQHPFITVWDDHELTNDSWQYGAQNHQPEEGDFEARKAAAIRAYFEWMPIRAVQNAEDGLIYRSFRFGDLVDMIMLDTRLFGRDQQLADACDTAALADPARQLLGKAQERWFFQELERSQRRGARFRLIGQQVMFGQLVNVIEPPGTCVFNTDQWDGYPAARARVLARLAEKRINNVVVLTGDIHSSWGSDITATPFDSATYDRVTGAGSVAVEVVTPAVTSPGIEDPAQAAAFAAVLRATHPHIKYVELSKRGYALLDITPERVQAEWYHLETILERRPDVILAAALQARAGENHFSPAAGPSLPRVDAPALAPVTAVIA
jgi:alkaline phosphatase D